MRPALVLCVFLVACGGEEARAPGWAVIGPVGGAVEGIDGAAIDVPAGALLLPTAISVARDSADAPPPPPDLLGNIYAVTPHGQGFMIPATVKIPFDPAGLRAGMRPVVMKAEVGGPWRQLEPIDTTGGYLTVEINDLSWFVATQGWIEQPTTPGPTTARLQLASQSAFVQLPATPAGVTIYQQPAREQPLQLQANVWIGSASPLVNACAGEVRAELVVSDAVIYHLPSDGDTAGINRVAFDRNTRVRYSIVPAAWPDDVLALDHPYTVTRTIDATATRWNPPSIFDVVYGARPVAIPADAVIDAGARYVDLEATCCGPAGCTLAQSAAPPLVVARGFPGTSIELQGQLPATLTAMAGTYLTLPPLTAHAPFAVTNVWQLRLPAGTEWSAVPPGGDVALPGPYVDASGELRAYATLALDGARFRQQVCGGGECVTSNETTIAATQRLIRPSFNCHTQTRTYRVGEQLSYAATFSGFPIPTLSGQTRSSAAATWESLGNVATTRVSGTTAYLSGATPLTIADRGRQFRLVATNTGGTATCAGVELQVTTGQTPPSITAQPQAATVPAGGPAEFAAAATGAPPLSFQWSKDGVPIVGANGPVLTLNAVTAASAGSYQLAVENVEDRVTTVPVTLTVTGGTVPPRIVLPPRGAAAQVGSPYAFAVVAAGDAPLAYQWRKDGIAIAGATASTLALPAVSDPDAGAYTVDVTNAAATITSADAPLTILPAPPAVGGAPVITAQPMAATAFEGDAATFTAAVTGTPAPVCLWLRSGIAIPMATSCTTFTTAPLSVADSGTTYNVIASNRNGTVVGDGAVVTVAAVQPPVIITEPVDRAVVVGEPVSFSVAATSNAALRFQWRRDGVDIPGGTDNRLTLPAAATPDSGARFSVRVCAGAPALGRCVTSREALLTVGPALPPGALTALQAVAGNRNSVVLRPDGTVWAWGEFYRTDGTYDRTGAPGQEALRPVRIYPAQLADAHQVASWADSFWALIGTPGAATSRVVHWGVARDGSDGRGTDGLGSVTGPPPQVRTNAAPVEVLERVGGVAVPVDRVCTIAGGAGRLAVIRAIAPSGATTDCGAAAEKTVWLVGSLTPYAVDTVPVARLMPGLPVDSPPTSVFFGQTYSGSPPLVIVLADGRAFALGDNSANGLGLPPPAPTAWFGGLGGPGQLPASWGTVRRVGLSFYYALFVVRDNGAVVTSGYNGGNELGLGTPVSMQVDGPLPVLAETCASAPCADTLVGVSELVTNSSLATLAIKNGALLGWGSGASGVLGPGVSMIQSQALPRPVPSTIAGFTALSSAMSHALVIGPGGAVYAWGDGGAGALGDGQTAGRRTAPGLVTTP